MSESVEPVDPTGWYTWLHRSMRNYLSSTIAEAVAERYADQGDPFEDPSSVYASTTMSAEAMIAAINQISYAASASESSDPETEEERLEKAGRSWKERRARLDEWLEESARIVDPDDRGWENHAGRSPDYDKVEEE